MEKIKNYVDFSNSISINEDFISTITDANQYTEDLGLYVNIQNSNLQNILLWSSKNYIDNFYLTFCKKINNENFIYENSLQLTTKESQWKVYFKKNYRVYSSNYSFYKNFPFNEYAFPVESDLRQLQLTIELYLLYSRGDQFTIKTYEEFDEYINTYGKFTDELIDTISIEDRVYSKFWKKVFSKHSTLREFLEYFFLFENTTIHKNNFSSDSILWTNSNSLLKRV